MKLLTLTFEKTEFIVVTDEHDCAHCFINGFEIIDLNKIKPVYKKLFLVLREELFENN
jgi:hypothetical protein